MRGLLLPKSLGMPPLPTEMPALLTARGIEDRQLQVAKFLGLFIVLLRRVLSVTWGGVERGGEGGMSKRRHAEMLMAPLLVAEANDPENERW